jgi:hypothetical protein
MQDPADEEGAEHLRRRAPARLAASPPPLSPTPPPLPPSPTPLQSRRTSRAASSLALRPHAASHGGSGEGIALRPHAASHGGGGGGIDGAPHPDAGGRRSPGSRPGSGLHGRKRVRRAGAWQLAVAGLATAACLVTLVLHPYSRCGGLRGGGHVGLRLFGREQQSLRLSPTQHSAAACRGRARADGPPNAPSSRPALQAPDHRGAAAAAAARRRAAAAAAAGRRAAATSAAQQRRRRRWRRRRPEPAGGAADAAGRADAHAAGHRP